MAPDAWMKEEGYAFAGESTKSLAGKWGVSPTTIYRPIKDRTLPSAEMIVRFHMESGGKVTLVDWIDFARDDLKARGLITRKGKGSGNVG